MATLNIEKVIRHEIEDGGATADNFFRRQAIISILESDDLIRFTDGVVEVSPVKAETPEEQELFEYGTELAFINTAAALDEQIAAAAEGRNP